MDQLAEAGRTVLQTERLRLRLLTEGDAPFYLALINSPGWLRFIGDRGVRTVEGARQIMVEGTMAQQARYGFSFYAVELKDAPPGSEPMGICGMVKRDALPEPEIGYAFMEPFWGRGYVQESARAVFAHARDVLKLPRLLAITSPDNDASIAILLKLGLAFQKVIYLKDDDPTNLYQVEFPQNQHKRMA
jgi:RimJ/RimL family protein N-acetyltransferase